MSAGTDVARQCKPEAKFLRRVKASDEVGHRQPVHPRSNICQKGKQNFENIFQRQKLGFHYPMLEMHLLIIFECWGGLRRSQRLHYPLLLSCLIHIGLNAMDPCWRLDPQMRSSNIYVAASHHHWNP